jgi:hypothetical protein
MRASEDLTTLARPTKFNTDRADRVLDALRAGNTRRAAAQYAGVDDRSLRRWIERFVHFAAAIEKAEADAEVRHVANIARAAQEGTWQASAWWLERRRPDDYGRRERIDVTVRQTAERLGAELGIDPDDLIREAERILSRG